MSRVTCHVSRSRVTPRAADPRYLLEPRPGQRCAGRNYPGGTRCCTPHQPCLEASVLLTGTIATEDGVYREVVIVVLNILTM